MACVRLSRHLAIFLSYALLSIALTIVLVIDPLINAPRGLIKLSWFTQAPVSHGFGVCDYDYEGTWAIGLARGGPDPLHLSFSKSPVITCATLLNATNVSFVADPFLFIPDEYANSGAFRNGSFFFAGDGRTLTTGASPPWFAFYEMKNLKRYVGELGVAVSYDQGASWRHLGTALQESFHLSYPLVLYDTDSSQYLMFAETTGARDGAIRVYGTSSEQFPFGWRVVAIKWPLDLGWPRTRSWFQFGAPAKYIDTTPVRFQNRWWIFTSRFGSPGAGQPKYTLLLYTAEQLLGEWEPHPATLLGAPFPGAGAAANRRVPFGIDTSKVTARNGGRAFVLNGTLYRWAQDCSRYYGEALTLMRADVANGTSYKEASFVRYEPTRDPESWRGERLHHADVHQLANGSWIGLADGDRSRDGMRHFQERERWFVQLKANLRTLVPLQFGLLVVALALARLPHLATSRAWRTAAWGQGVWSSGGGGNGRRIRGSP